MCKGLYRLKAEEAVMMILKKRSILLDCSGQEHRTVITIEYLRPAEICFSINLSHTEGVCVPVLGLDARFLIGEVRPARWDWPCLESSAANHSDRKEEDEPDPV